MDIMKGIHARAKEAHKRIVLPEGCDERVMRAASAITKDGMAEMTLLGNIEKIQELADKLNIDLTGIKLADPTKHQLYDDFAKAYYELRKHKGMTEERAYEEMKDPLLFGVMMLKNDIVDGLVAGAVATTADVLRPGFTVIRTDPNVSLASAYFIMITPNKDIGEDGVILFADGGVNPTLTAEEMADVAYATACSSRNILGFTEPRVAMISYSTLGSASHPSVDKVAQAVKIAHEKYPDLLVDGEMQLDAAVSPEVAALKAPNSPVAGRANILVFPDLNCANTCYKAVQRFGGARAIGPLLQGMAKPMNDLSRGCSTQDIVDAVAVVCCNGK